MSDVVTDHTAFPHAFDAALNSGDVERLMSLYDANATIHVRTGDVHSGLEAVRAETEKLMAAKAFIDNKLRRSFRSGDTALIIVDYVLKLTTPDDDPVEVTGTATNVLRHDPEYGWRMLISNPQGVA